MAKERVTTYIEEGLWVKLKKLSDDTRIPLARYMQEAIEDLLIKYGVK